MLDQEIINEVVLFPRLPHFFCTVYYPFRSVTLTSGRCMRVLWITVRLAIYWSHNFLDTTNLLVIGVKTTMLWKHYFRLSFYYLYGNRLPWRWVSNLKLVSKNAGYVIFFYEVLSNRLTSMISPSLNILPVVKCTERVLCSWFSNCGDVPYNLLRQRFKLRRATQ